MKINTRNNPNKANQYKPDPRQSLFLANYLDPKSATFSNALRSALKAGYEQEYAESITSLMPAWLSDELGKSRMVEKAESNLREFLELDTEQFPKVKLDATKFILERLKKDKYGKEPDEAKDQTLIINHVTFNYAG